MSRGEVHRHGSFRITSFKSLTSCELLAQNRCTQGYMLAGKIAYGSPSHVLFHGFPLPLHSFTHSFHSLTHSFILSFSIHR